MSTNLINTLPFGYKATMDLATKISSANNRALAAAQKTAFVAGSVFVAIAETVRNIFTGLINAVILPINAIHHKLHKDEEVVKTAPEPVMGVVVEMSSEEKPLKLMSAAPAETVVKEAVASRSIVKPVLLTLAGLGAIGVAAYYFSGSLGQTPNPWYGPARLPQPPVNLNQCGPQDFMAEDFYNNHIQSFASDAPYWTQFCNLFKGWFTPSNSTHA